MNNEVGAKKNGQANIIGLSSKVVQTLFITQYFFYDLKRLADLDLNEKWFKILVSKKL